MITWQSGLRNSDIGIDRKHNSVIQVIPVENGWDVWVFNWFCGTYLTREMAQGAALGLHKIALHGSTIERWQYGKIWGGNAN